MTAVELLAAIRDANPAHRFARTANGNAIGLWVEEWNRFAPRWWRTGNQWCDMGERELLGSDGKSPAFAPSDWIE